MTRWSVGAALVAVCTVAPALRAQADSAATEAPVLASDSGAGAVRPGTDSSGGATDRTPADSTIADSVTSVDLSATAAPAGPRLTALGPSLSGPGAPADTGEARPRAIEYSDAYGTRLAIHRYASYAELPLFAVEYALGQKILNGERTGDFASSGTRSAHSVVAGTLGVLFAVNTVTGVWNMIEARHDPAGRTRRNIHALGMLLADAGFLYTASLAEGARESVHGADKHRNAAIASISVATASTLMMWLWKD
jgi:hypothetical protein